MSFPDENLVRMLAKDNVRQGASALDLGCGSGRHIPLLESFGYRAVGSDISHNALKLSITLSDTLVQCKNTALPFRSESFDCVCSWGSLHYCSRQDTAKQIGEIFRVLSAGGFLYGTLRSQSDTFFERIERRESSWLCRSSSLDPLLVTFFSENELDDIFSRFSSFSYGLCERTQLGEKGRISHWFFRAVK